MEPTGRAHGRPPAGFGHYLRDVVYGAMDGVITTFAIVAGVAGASLEPRIAIILGLANLVADGLSMGVSNYLGLKSELEMTGVSVAVEMPWRHGAATFAAFVAAGAVPLVGFALGPPLGVPVFVLASVLAGATFLAVGALRAPYLGRSVAVSALELLLLGAAAASAAYAIGYGVSRLV